MALLDPPYDRTDLDAASPRGRAAAPPAARLVLEHSRGGVPPDAVRRLRAGTRTLVAGDSALSCFRSAVAGPHRRWHTRTLAIYPGSFDPLTNGHVDIIQRGARLFDRIIVAILVNAAKPPLFTRRTSASRSCARSSPDAPTSKSTRSTGCSSTTRAQRQARVIVRGLRRGSDFEYEMQMALMNRHLKPRSRPCS